jgi:diguanylate cyclase (GGDEF)-like protein/PAS domain S-box-containing protein
MSTKFFRLIGSLSVGRKLALIYFLDLITVIFISGILVNEKYIAINFANKEIEGNAYIGVVRDVLLNVADRNIRSQTSVLPPTTTLTAETHVASVQAVRAAESRFGSEMQSARLSQAFVSALILHAPAELDNNRTRALVAGRELLTRIGNQSNLILDPDLDSYYTMSLVVLRFPELLEVLDSMGRLSRSMAGLPPLAQQSLQTQFLILEGRISAILSDIDSDYQEAFAASKASNTSLASLRVRLAPSQINLKLALQQFRESRVQLAGMSSNINADALSELPSARVLGDVTPIFLTLGQAWSAAGNELQLLLEQRKARAFQRMWQHLGTALLLMALILVLVYLVARQIARPIRQLAAVAERVRHSGDYSLRASWDSSDEIGRLVNVFNGMLQQLDTQRLGQQELIAQASTAQAQRAMIEAIPIPLIVTSIPDHRVLHANEAAHDWLGGHDRNPWEYGMTPALRVRFFQALGDTGVVDAFEVSWLAGVTPSWALVSARRLSYQGQPAMLATFTPINRVKQMESGLELWAKVFEATSESIIVMNAKGCVLTVNPAFMRGTTFDMYELIGKPLNMLMAERNDTNLLETIHHITALKGSWQGEVWIKRRRGEVYPVWLVMNAVRDVNANITHFIAMSLDITERKANEQRINYLAHHDALTGLPNRFSCDERLILSIQQARRLNTKVAVLFIDLDRFKNINDSLGHPIGDQLLCSVASRFLNAVFEGDTVSRLGGDEFVIILNNVVNAQEIGTIVENRLIAAVRKPHLIDGNELYISCSVGAAIFPDDADDIENLMRHADSAMYQAKKLGRNNFQFFTPALNRLVTRHLHLESDLRRAVERNELVLHYQPRIDACSGHLASVESLVRWQHPVEGLIEPAQFIPLAEEAGLVVEIGAWVIRHACQQHQLWCAEGLGPIPISINLSALQLKDKGLLPTLTQALTDNNVPATQIELELTESLLMENVDATIAMLDQIKALGCSLSIDDFGTGYSSLNYLYRFPIDKLKIDRSFIQNIHVGADNLAVIKAIIGLGHTLGLKVVAEGVEKVSDVLLLKAAGCDELQGFYFAKPMAAADFTTWFGVYRN